MTSKQETHANDLFMLAYAQAIKDKAGAHFGKTGAFFVSQDTQTGPPAGEFIPDAYTYQGLYDIADNLLPTDNLYYNPSAEHRYTEALDTFLNWVDLGGHPSAALKLKQAQLQQDSDAAYKAVKHQYQLAKTEFTEMKTDGMIPDGQNLYEWISQGNAPAYTTALRNQQQIAAQLQQIANEIGGPMAAASQRARQGLTNAWDISRPIVGFNMTAAVGDLPSADEISRAISGGDKLPQPSITYVPEYNASRYAQVVKDAFEGFGNKSRTQDSLEITIDSGKTSSDYDFGQNDKSSYSGAGWWWFGWHESSESHEQSESMISSDEESSVKVKMTFDSIEKIDIQPGAWNFDVTNFKLREDAPKDLRTFARVNSIVVAFRLGYEITVGAKSASNIDKKMSQSSSEHGGFRIFGCWAGSEHSSSSSKKTESHKATWDAATKTFKVAPKDITGTATVLAVIGEKFTIL